MAAIGESIRLGFISIKGVGFDVGEFIQKERERWGNYLSLEDFCKRCANVINKKSLEWLIKSGALDSFADRKVLWGNVEVIQDWIKTSANADQGLFGGLETVIPLKRVDPASHMQKIMMEQEVFKTFVSGNPLDGFYKFAKKHSFLSQVLTKDEYPYFEIIAYIKDIRKAKKKGFFVKFADITADFEVFLTDLCGLEKFDLLILSGAKKCYETKDWVKKSRINVYKIIKTTYEKLQNLAGGLFDPQDTVVSVMKARWEELKPVFSQPFIPSDSSTNFISEKEKVNSIEDEEDADETWSSLSDFDSSDFWEVLQNDSQSSDVTEFEDDNLNEEKNNIWWLAKNADDLWIPFSEAETNNVELKWLIEMDTSHLTTSQFHEVIQIIKMYPWKNPLHVMGKEVFISDEWWELLQKFVI